MKTTRRIFLRNSAVAVAASATAFLPRRLFAMDTGKLVGVQLYSVRDDMKRDPLGTLKQVAAAGYKNVEHADYVKRKFYGYDPKEFKTILNDLGLSMPSGHTVLAKNHWDATTKDFTDSWKYTVEDAATLGQHYVISPWLDESLRKTADDLKAYMDVFNKCGELCKKSGMMFGYHNHDFEFNSKFGDQTVYDIIMKNTDPSLVIHQLDVGNMYSAGGIAQDIIKKYPGRFQSMHVKDEIKSSAGHGGYESAVLGAGILDVKAIVDLGLKVGGTKDFIIEQESYQGKAPIDCIREDLNKMKEWGY